MPSLRDYHILISHSWDYNMHYETIRGWLNDTPFFLWTDYSVPITRPLTVSGVNELKQKIRDRISLCSCVIILSGMYVVYSDWIDFEIDTAVAMGKPIIGITMILPDLVIHSRGVKMHPITKALHRSSGQILIQQEMISTKKEKHILMALRLQMKFLLEVAVNILVIIHI